MPPALGNNGGGAADSSRRGRGSMIGDGTASAISARKDANAAAAELLSDLHGQLSQHHRGLLAGSRTFLPDVIVDAINSKELSESCLIVKRCHGAVVFSDASGFTALTERLALRSNGAEVLSKCLNKFFTPLIDMLSAYRGDVIKFSGDALTILFAATNDNEDFVHACGSPSCAHAPLELACLRACACCIEIHKRLHNFDTGEGDVRLTLHIGVGAGLVTILQVGGDQNRYEYVIAGQPLEQIAVAEPLAGSGETVLSPQAWVQVAETVIEGAPLQGNSEYHRLKALDITRHSYPTVKQAARQSQVSYLSQASEVIDDEELERRLRFSMRFIPRSVLKQFCTGSLRGINEMRMVSIFFVKVGGVDVSTDPGALKARALMQDMQAVCYSEEGSLNKFLVDDKGLTFLFVFGLPPLVHIDDPTRACRASLEMSALLMQMELTGRVGVTTGRVYCGLVGSDTRREYTVMGDTVNLSARLTANAQANTVLADEATYKRCQGDIVFSKLQAIRVKGKEHRVPVFRPLHAKEGTQDLEPHPAKQQIGSAGQELRLHLPWPPRSRALGGRSPLSDMSSWHAWAHVKEVVGRSLLHGGGVLVVAGESGCGKEELAENVLNQCVGSEGMLPLFGTMQMRAKERWAAPRELIGGLLRQLHRSSSEPKVAHLSDEELQELLSKEQLSAAEKAAAVALEVKHSTANMRRSSTYSRPDPVWTPGTSTARRTWGIAECARLDHEHTDEHIVCDLVSRLLERLLQQRRVILVLRCWRGTALSPGDTSIFWLLSKRIGELALRQPPGRLLVVVLCRTLPGEEGSEPGTLLADSQQSQESCTGSLNRKSSLGVPHELINLQPLTDKEAHIFTGLALGVGTPDAPSSAVPEALRVFLSNIALNNPRNILEALAELQEAEKIRVVDGQVALLTDPCAVDIAEWVHTSMVGNLISQIEMMGAEAQRVIKIATVLDGPFSALDIAAANRVHLPDSDLLAWYDSVQLLMACEWLVGQGFLRHFDYGSSSPADRQTPRLPRWEISNLLIRKVVGAALLQSQKMLVKRSVLVSRALNIYLPAKMRAKAEMRERLFGQPSKAELSRQQRRRATPHQILTRASDPTPLSGLPSSCIVLPVTHPMESMPLSPVEYYADRPRRSSLQASSSFLVPPVAQISRPVMGTIPESHLTMRVHGDQCMPDIDRTADWLLLMCAAPHRHRALELIERCAPVATRDAAGMSPLHFASANGDLELVQALLTAAADPAAAAPQVGVPLELAAAHGHMEVARYLATLNGAKACARKRSKSAWHEVAPGGSTLEVPLPVLGHDLPVRSRLEEANYRRSQTLAFLQDSIALTDDDGKDPGSPDGEDGELGEVRARPPSKVSTASVAPKSTLDMVRQSRWTAAMMLAATLVAIFGPDVCIIAGGSQAILDGCLFAAMLFFVAQIAVMVATQPGYTRTFFFLLDLVGAGALMLDISWLLGTSDDDPMTKETPLNGRSGSYNMELARLARGADIGNRAGRFSCMTRLINVLCFCCLRPSQGGDYGSVEVFRQQLMRSITTHVACLTTLLVVVLPLLNFMSSPSSDYSMLAWVTILAGYWNTSSPAWQREIGEFEQFYEQLALYGPYHLCSGSGAGPAFRCAANGSLWGWGEEDGWPFAAPRVEAARLRVRAASLEALFDFSIARKREAWMNVVLVFFAFTVMALTSLFITRAISDLVLRPLQRMLVSVKKIAQPILGDVSALGLNSTDGDFDKKVCDDEIYVLERIVQKLGKIAGIAAELSASRYGSPIESLDNGDREDRGVMQMMFHPTRKKTTSSNAAGSAASSKSTVSRPEAKPHLLDEELQSLGLTFEELCSWDFNVLNLDRPRLIGMAHCLLLQNTTARGEIQLSPDVAQKFLENLGKQYLAENPYHNFQHALDVLHTNWMMLRIAQADDFLTSLDQFSLLVSAVAHDVGHLGVNNQFLVATGHELAMRYNDRSPLENLHCAKAFGIASGTPGANIFETLSRSDFFESRRICIEAILHTDMVHHFDMIKETQMLYQMNVEALETDPTGLFREKSTRQKVLNLWLHSADVSNPCKPWAICQDWAHGILDEFFAQGDKEKQLGIPVQMLNDRTKVNRPFSQIGFIEFMIVPLYAAKVKLFPMMYELTEFLQQNMQEWRRLWIEEDSPNDEDRDKVAARIRRMSDLLTEAVQSSRTLVWSRLDSDAEVTQEQHDPASQRGVD